MKRNEMEWDYVFEKVEQTLGSFFVIAAMDIENLQGIMNIMVSEIFNSRL